MNMKAPLLCQLEVMSECSLVAHQVLLSLQVVWLRGIETAPTRLMHTLTLRSLELCSLILALVLYTTYRIVLI